MVPDCMRRCSASLWRRRVLKPQQDTFLDEHELKSLIMCSMEDSVRKWPAAATKGRSINWPNLLEEHCGSSYPNVINVPFRWAIPRLEIYPTEMLTHVSKIYIYKDGH